MKLIAFFRQTSQSIEILHLGNYYLFVLESHIQQYFSYVTAVCKYLNIDQTNQ